MKPANMYLEDVIIAFASYSECRDRSTVGHLRRVGNISELLSMQLAEIPRYKDYLYKENIKNIKLASMMHDVGKIHISDSILLKPGPLSREEYEIMKYHTTVDDTFLVPLRSVIKNTDLFNMVVNVIKYHHENYDGTGYITGIKGDQIPLEAQITSIADVYDAIRSRRCYKQAKTHDQAKEIIKSYRRIKFSDDLVDAFLAIDKNVQELYN